MREGGGEENKTVGIECATKKKKMKQNRQKITRVETKKDFTC